MAGLLALLMLNLLMQIAKIVLFVTICDLLAVKSCYCLQIARNSHNLVRKKPHCQGRQFLNRIKPQFLTTLALKGIVLASFSSILGFCSLLPFGEFYL